MALLPFSEWLPDVSSINGRHTQSVLNVLPQADGYGPMPDVSVFTAALPAQCRGSFQARKEDGTVRLFAGTSTKLYALDNTSLAWTDVSKAAGTYSALSSTANWSFVQFNDKVIASQANAVMQVIDVDTDTEFADLGGSPPQAAYLAVVNRFVVASGIAATPRRVQWCGLNAITTWTSGTTYSDYQDLPDGGNALKVIGGEFGVILQDNAIRRMVFTPGADIVFQIDRIATDVGTIAPWSVVESAGLIYFLSAKGFMKASSDGALTPIGLEKVDRTFFRAADLTAPQYIIGAAAPSSHMILWTYREDASTTNGFDAVLAYNTMLERWAPLDLTGEYIASMGKPGLTLESLGTIGQRAISGAANNGSGKVRLTVSSTTGWTTGDIKDISGIVGTTEANGTFAITVINGTTIDLTTVTYSNAYVSGGYVAGSIDDLTVSLDDFSAATLNQLAMVDTSHKLGYFTGSNLEATLTTSEQSGIRKRLCVTELHPLTDATTCYGSVGRRENLQAAATYEANNTDDETALNSAGFCPTRISTRYASMRIRIPSGTTWTFATGIDPLIVHEGRR